MTDALQKSIVLAAPTHCRCPDYGVQLQLVDTPAEVVITWPPVVGVHVTSMTCVFEYWHCSTVAWVGPVNTVWLVTTLHGATLDGGPFRFVMVSETQLAEA